MIRVHLAAAMVDQPGTLTVNAAVDSQQKAESSALVQWPLDTGSNMAKSTGSTSRSLAAAAIVRTLNALHYLSFSLPVSPSLGGRYR